MTIEENVPLSRLTTFRTGGFARYMLSDLGTEDMGDVFAFALDKNLPLIPIGDGSNILAPDEGVEAIFVRFRVGGVRELQSDGNTVTVSVEAGCSWDGFVEQAVSKGWWGVENLTSIPGTVGAAVVQNIGAYGAALEESIVAVEAFDMRTKSLIKFSSEKCGFGYRTSIFKAERDRYLITSVTFRLGTIPSPRLSYKDVSLHFATTGEEPTLAHIRRVVARIREGKFPPLSEYGTAGSFFLNPVLSEKEAHDVQSRFSGMPIFPMPEGGVKIPLAWILDRTLNLKGLRVGGAFLWDAQPLVIVADKGATTRDIMALAREVETRVKEKTGISITPEVRLLVNER